MPKVICLVVAKDILEKPAVSFRFMADSEMPAGFYPYADRFGTILLKMKPSDFFNPFSIGCPPSETESDKDQKRWNLHIFESGRGQILALGVDEDIDHEGLRRTFLEDVPECVLLTDQHTSQTLERALIGLDIEIRQHQCDAILVTA
jgi:hypothetical protein